MLILELPDQVQAGLDAGEEIGTALLQLEGKTIASVPLVAGEALARRDYGFELKRIVHHWMLTGEEIAQ